MENTSAVLKFKKISENATSPSKCISVGFYLFSAYDVTILPNENAKIDTDIAISLQTRESCYARIAPITEMVRKHHVTTLGGIIDQDYTGNIGVILMNNDEDKSYEIIKGQKIAQLICQKACFPTHLTEYADLKTTSPELDELKFEKTDLPLAKRPLRCFDTAAGFDLFATTEAEIGPKQIERIHTGIKILHPAGYYGRIAPRSGMALNNKISVLSGNVSDREEVIIMLLNNSATDTYHVKVGDKIAQLICQKAYPIHKAEEMKCGEDFPNEHTGLMYKRITKSSKSPCGIVSGFWILNPTRLTLPSNSHLEISTELALSIPSGCYGRIDHQILGEHGGAPVTVQEQVIERMNNSRIISISVSNSDYHAIGEGELLAYLVCESIVIPELEEVTFIDEKPKGRRSNGFGSTGK